MVTARGLSPILKKTYALLKVKATTEYVVEKTGRDIRLVSKDIKRLIDRGFVTRISPGFFQINESPKQNQHITLDHQEKRDYFRYHNLMIEVRLRKDELDFLRNTIIKSQEIDKRAHGIYFEYIVTGLISSDSLFLYFPENWDVEADTYRELMDKVYDLILDMLHKWSNKYKIGIFKDNRVNFNIRNQHIAITKNGVAEQFRNTKTKQLVVYDSEDGKARFLMDFSNGLAELEAVHAKKAGSDIQEAKFFMDTLKDGDYRHMFDDWHTFLDEKQYLTSSEIRTSIGEIGHLLSKQSEQQLYTTQQIEALTKTLAILIQSQINQINGKLIPTQINPDKGKPPYVS
jgi:hypothetical protein